MTNDCPPPAGSRHRSAQSSAERIGARTPAEERRIRRIVGVSIPVMRALASTWRVRETGAAAVRQLRAEHRSFVFACWHGELLPLVWHHRGQPIRMLVSEHRDGEIITRIAERLGFGTIRGSTTRGGGRALLALTRALEQGHDVAVTPDGPRGPARRYAPGALVAANRAHAPIVPVVLAVDRAWRLSSWDRFVIPKPFARITVAYGAPTLVDADTSRDAAAAADRFTALHEAVARLARP